MFSSLRDRFGTAGLVVAVMALVIALVGTAYAASKLNSKQKKEVEKIAKKYAGKPGAPGTPGAQGAKGDTGAPGSNGSNGKSVVVGTATAGECPTSNPPGGATVEVEGSPATKKKICNGKEGSPWTDGGVLPSGATETGAWSLITQASDFGTAAIPAISFTIPLAADIEFSNTHINQPETEDCPGTAEEPLAKEGHLCIYVGANFGVTLVNALNPEQLSVGGAGNTGALILAEGAAAGKVAWGTWAVTAP